MQKKRKSLTSHKSHNDQIESNHQERNISSPAYEYTSNFAGGESAEVPVARQQRRWEQEDDAAR